MSITCRKDPTFIFWYTLSLAWHPTLTTGILPFIALLYMNMHIFIGIRKSRQVRSFNELNDIYVVLAQVPGVARRIKKMIFDF